MWLTHKYRNFLITPINSLKFNCVTIIVFMSVKCGDFQNAGENVTYLDKCTK
jgi:hypothetical protein